MRAFEAMWGLTGPLEERLAGIKARGYDGVEAGVPGVLSALGQLTPAEAADFAPMLAAHDLEYLAQVFTFDGRRVPGSTHIGSMRDQVEQAMSLGAVQITMHTGSDGMDLGEAIPLFEAALQLEEATGVPIGHESHRGRVLYSPAAWREVHARLPELRTVADLSHWVVVCERLPLDLADVVTTLCQRAVHVHARVGHPEGPQLADPRLPEHLPLVDWHEARWREVFEARAADGDQAVTFDPEYGPAPYLPTDPRSGEPFVSMEELRGWGAARVRALAADVVGVPAARP